MEAATLTLEEFARVTVRIELGDAVSSVLSEHALDPPQWAAIQRTWLQRMAKRAVKGKPSLHRRFVELLDEQRTDLLALRQREKQLDGELPTPPEERKAPQLGTHRRRVRRPSQAAVPVPLPRSAVPLPGPVGTPMGRVPVMPFKGGTADHTDSLRKHDDGALPFSNRRSSRPALPFQPEKAPSSTTMDLDGGDETIDQDPPHRPSALPFAAHGDSANRGAAAKRSVDLSGRVDVHVPFGRGDAAVPNQAVPNQAAPNQAAPNQAAPNQAAPNQAAPNQAAREEPVDLSGPVDLTGTLDVSSADLAAARAVLMPFEKKSAPKKETEAKPDFRSTAHIAVSDLKQLRAALPFGTPPEPTERAAPTSGGLPFAKPKKSEAATKTAALPTTTATPELSVEQYAWLCATLERNSGGAKETLAWLRLTAEAKVQLDAHWERMLANDPELRRRFEASRSAYLAKG